MFLDTLCNIVCWFARGGSPATSECYLENFGNAWSKLDGIPMVPRGFSHLPLAEKRRGTEQQTSFRASSGKKSNDLPNAFISV